MMKVAEITASTTLQNTADKYDKLAKERKKREQIRKTRVRLSKQQQQLVQLVGVGFYLCTTLCHLPVWWRLCTMIYDFFLFIVVISVLGGVIKPCTNIKPNWMSWVCVLLTSFIAILAFISGLSAFWFSLLNDDVIFWKQWLEAAWLLLQGEV